MKWYRFDVVLGLIVCSFFLGIFLGSQNIFTLFHETYLTIAFSVFLIACLGIGLFFGSVRTKLLLLFLTLMFCALGVIRFHIDKRVTVSPLLDQVGTTVQTEGYITTVPDVGDYSTRFTLKTKDENILVTTTTKNVPQIGTYVHLTGIPTIPKSFVTDTDRVFDYGNYLKKDGIAVVFKASSLAEDTSVKQCCFVSRNLSLLNMFFVSHIYKILPDTDAGLLSGILLGQKSDLDPALRASFVKTGTIHIVALSGYNVTIVADAIIRLLRTVFSRSVTFLFGGFGIFAFVVMTGLQTTAIRAGAMACVLLLTKGSGRMYNALRALWYVSFVMVAINPRILLYDISFQLSFLATLSIILFLPPMTEWLSWIRTKLIRETLASTLAAQMLVTPWIAYSIGTLSFISPLANLIVLPFISLIMFLGFIAIIMSVLGLGVIVPIVSYPLYAMLEFVITTATKLSQVPYASTVVPVFSTFFLVGVYVLIFGLLYLYYTSPKIKSTRDM
jgi:competence protein ComEC